VEILQLALAVEAAAQMMQMLEQQVALVLL